MHETRTEPFHAVDLAVVGGGLAGLVAAVAAADARPGSRIVIIDSAPLGGRARVDERDGYLFNRGPRALYLGGPADRILGELGAPTRSGAKPNMEHAAVRHGGVLHRFPGGGIDALATTLLSPREKAAAGRALTGALVRGPSAQPDQSVAAWLDQRSIRGTPRLLVEALVRLSTYADAPSELSAPAAFAMTRSAITRGVRYLDGGWQSLVDHLADLAAERGVHHIKAKALAVRPPSGSSDLELHLDADRSVRATSVVLAVGTPAAASNLLGHRPDSWAPDGPAAAVACLELGLRRPPHRRFVLGIDEPTYLSVHSPPARLAPAGHAVLHAMHAIDPHDTTAPEVLRDRLRALAAAAGVTEADIETERFLARMVVTASLPTAANGGLAGRPPVAVEEVPGAFLAGDWVGPEGLLLDGALASAHDAGRRAAARSATMVLR